GSVAPMSFLSFQDVRRYAEKMKAVLSDGSMPPWPADPSVGQFANSKRLTGKEKDLLMTWIDSGFPRGDAEYAPDERWLSEWTIGEPDQVFEMEEYEIPADATEHVYEFTIDPEIDEDKWIVAAEAMPGDPFLVR